MRQARREMNPAHREMNPAHRDMVLASRYSAQWKDSVIGPAELNAVRSFFAWLLANVRPVDGMAGAYGSIFIVRSDKLRAFRQALTRVSASLQRHPDLWVSGVPRRPVIVKVQSQTNLYPIDVQRRLWHNEVQIQRMLSRFPFVPSVYAALMTRTKHLTVMQYVEGVPLRKILPTVRSHKKHAFLRLVYRNVSRALILMWKEGVLHLDMHGDNVLVDQKGRVTFIDFGLSTVNEKVRAAARRFNPEADALQYWKYVEPYAVSYVQHRSLPYYHPNITVLQKLKRRL